jgi:hypothetical protein
MQPLDLTILPGSSVSVRSGVFGVGMKDAGLTGNESKFGS